MNYEQQIHARWAADSPLNTAIPAASFQTGVFFTDEPDYPYATLTFPGGAPRTYTTHNAIASQTARIALYDRMDRHDECKANMDHVVRVFDRATISLADSKTVLNMQLVGEPSQLQDEDGDWYMIADFTLTIV